MGLDKSPVSSLKGVGPALAGKLAKIGIFTLQDVLFHLPFRYEDRTRITPIGMLVPGKSVVLEGEIISCDIAYGRRRSLLAYLQDSTGQIALRFFHFTKAQQRNLSSSRSIRCFGEARLGATGLEIYHPEYSQNVSAELPKHFTPVYPGTEGVSQQRYRKIVSQVFALMSSGDQLDELMGDIEHPYEIDINNALDLVHNPPHDVDMDALLAGRHLAQQNLAFEELLAHQISLRLVRDEINRLEAPCFHSPGIDYKALISSFGYELTDAQIRVAGEVAIDMAQTSPTLRLIQGDVGSGKTVIAALSAVHAHENGYQCALMAPTEILAEQHFINLSSWLTPLGITTAWLTGKVKGKRRREELESIASGSARVVIGTHALFQKDVQFGNLGLVIIDEQHRFGVHQRLALREKGNKDKFMPHQLIMTATPIPRTLTMSMYADMDCSIIDELPPGRKPVTTNVLPDSRRDDVVTRVKSACQSGAQAYWVCTLVEESEIIQCQAAEATATDLSRELKGLEVGLIHGRLPAAEKAETMNQFKAGEIDLLVATTVIEVGVDVPNASLMVIENSERLGLAQLHQLRGRIGRGKAQSHCLLLYHSPLGETSRQRLNVLRESNDGFHIAEMDLQIRGPGELFGSRQSGSLQFRIADLLRDHHMLDDIARIANQLLRNDQISARAIIERWIVSPEEFSQA
ncbi:MAG: ATP-dependent DNA helicase RecG [Gammaproteobacteria bacterium]|jgi:ATP-dependent DNA helicase RecG|nr:ATP-dependent DNA helicase RecG [Gammaproteobacteria bacterium]